MRVGAGARAVIDDDDLVDLRRERAEAPEDAVIGVEGGDDGDDAFGGAGGELTPGGLVEGIRLV